MIKPEHGHKSKQTSKPTPKQKLCFKINVKPMNGGMNINQEIEGYTAVEVLGIIELIRIDVIKTINNNPPIRDEKDDLL